MNGTRLVSSLQPGDVWPAFFATDQRRGGVDQNRFLLMDYGWESVDSSSSSSVGAFRR